ncbi:phosphoribosylformylglycinamidine synthase subunit PurQ [Lacibacterium aquatile]|uniref:Phosphoribosylformylglycinamidine synthase subunit PurQ n=1 Tax=Lacibacterium aquatile TaxID=1168082 RepID=A0ABW5DWZ1_9PROT
MKVGIVVFPGINRERDAAAAFRTIAGTEPVMIWHRETELPSGLDLIFVPGGFSYGDYLRPGAMAAHSPIMREIKTAADQGRHVVGVCNGFQIICEAGLLPGALMRNASLKFVCRDVLLAVETSNSPFTRSYNAGDVLQVPVAHHDGNYFADQKTLDTLEGEDRIAFRYCDPEGYAEEGWNPNGAQRNIAGILSENRRVLGMMPHPENAIDPLLGSTDGAGLFTSIATALVS